ncbi:P-loop containing nucleoside triphosphate hydrolase protein [Lasiosphaeria hispida]|uniref:P-loop containing nucleoside triphosphate hydrolase protein n=1 Tax=Lasiosphaeria hispida TaxID=260671 RepID=A0AAJ0MGX5_9PEZI|nr:P-loop containing nucleoside triphosphate hydrolase protein [Lasiosphaeria hispida]
MDENPDGMIVVLGVTGAGKSYLVNQLMDGAVKEGKTLHAETATCQAVEIELDYQYGGEKRRITVVDTPGFNDTTRPDGEILAEISEFLAAQRGSRIPLRGILYLHKITGNRMTGSDETYLSLLESLVGDEALPNVILVTTMWNKMRDEDEAEGMQREQDLIDNYWAPLISKGSFNAQFDGTSECAFSLVSQLAARDSIVLKVQKEVWDEEKPIIRTTAGQKLWNKLSTRKESLERRLTDVDKRIQAGTSGLRTERSSIQAVLSRIARSFTKMSERPGPGFKSRIAEIVAGTGATGQTIRMLMTLFNIALFVVSVIP